jgi:hypothetical protein
MEESETMDVADIPTGHVGGERGETWGTLKQVSRLTAPWRFEPSPYSYYKDDLR